MGIFVIGVLFLLLAAGNGLHLDFLLNEEYRGTQAGRDFQRRNVLPYGILGLLFLVWGRLSGSALDCGGGLDPRGPAVQKPQQIIAGVQGRKGKIKKCHPDEQREEGSRKRKYALLFTGSFAYISFSISLSP